MKRLLAMMYLTPAILLGACATNEEEKPQPSRSENYTRIVGRVEKVDLDAQFVFFRRYGAWRFDEVVEVLVSQGEHGRTANLLPTGEKLGEHIAADIRSGEVAVGDVVLVKKFIKEEKVPTEEGDQDEDIEMSE